MTTTIRSRFNGPPTSANGGYACGVAAGLFREPATVTLIAPPPLDVDVALERTDDGFRVTGPSGPWAAVGPREVGIDTIDPVRLEEARVAAERFDVAAYRDAHVFATCFTCGPDRGPTDGLRLFPGEHPVREGVVTWPWTPRPEHADDDGHVGEEILWAALDCPSGLAWMTEVDGVFVLGRMAATVERRPRVGEDLVTAGWRGDRDDRRLHAGSAIWDERGAVVAAARTTWFLLTDEQAAAFGRSADTADPG